MKFVERTKEDEEAKASLAVYQQVTQASKTKVLTPHLPESKLSTLSPRVVGTTGPVITSPYVSPRAEPPVRAPVGRLQSASRQNSHVQMISPRTTGKISIFILVVLFMTYNVIIIIYLFIKDMKSPITSPHNTPRGGGGKILPAA